VPAIPPAVEEVVESGRLAHLVTLNPDGSPQVTCVWVGVDGDEIVVAHLGSGQKVKNAERDARVSLSIETDAENPMGLTEYLVVYGRARVTQGGAAELLQHLAHRYMGPDVKFPPMDNPPPGRILHIQPERYAGVGPWSGSAT
jgi:PPOX class probable F420-dependent enzyme